jgi:hypothetical protein
MTLLSATTASARGASAGGYTDGSGGGVRVDAPGSGGSPGGGNRDGGQSSTRTCAYFSVVPGEPPFVGPRITDTSTLEPGTPVVLQCRDNTTGEIVYSLLQQWDPATAIDTGPTVAELAQQAANAVTVPVPAVRTWPAGETGLVNLPVWLHVDNWAVMSASASAGGLTATVEAVPVRALWTVGTEIVVCGDAGTEWTPGASTSSCSYTFRRSSGTDPGGLAPVSVSVVWHLRWSATDGQVGDLGEVTSPAAAFGLRIEESQALVAPGRG